MLPKMTKEELASLKEILNVVGYEGVLRGLIKLAKRNQKSHWMSAFVGESHYSHIKNMKKCLRKIRETSAKVKLYLGCN
jgi:hypothetical protein